MFGILSSLWKKSPVKVRGSSRLAVEALEERFCLASSISLGAVVQAGHTVLLSGAVTGDHVAGFTVVFSGAVDGSTTTDSTGNYRYTTTQASLGTVSAVGYDVMLHWTNTAEATIAVTAPSVTLAISSISQNNVTLTGQLTGLDAGGRSISYFGVTSGWVTTNSSGYFTINTSSSSLGNISVSATDLWGQTSNTPSVTLTSNVPVIEDFFAEHELGDVWTFTGRVVDETAESLTLRFGGLASLLGRTVSVLSDGTFSFTCTILASEIPGTATAIVADWWGQDSLEVLFSL